MGSTGQIGESKGRRLDSWKAIAQYLDRDVRSVQRWEHERGLPVYRLPGQKGGAVFAYEYELELWLRSRESDAPALSDDASGSAAITATHVAAHGQLFSKSPRSIRLLALVGATVLAAILVAVAASRWAPLNVPAPPVFAPRSIAVLPMKNLSGDAAQEYFADGFTEELVTELAQVRSLRVISRTSTMIYKGSRKSLPEIARELNAKYVLEGSVMRDGGRVRVIAQLIDAGTDTHLSARTYNTDVKDVLDIQGQISRAIADDVRIDLSPQEKARLAEVHAVDPEAHDLYLQGSYQFAQQTPASIRESLALYTAAAAKDSSFARAYVGIAQAEAALTQITAESPNESALHEKQALAKALAIDPHLGDAHGMLASLTYYRDWDWPRAEREFRLAFANGAQAPTEQRYGYALVSRGRFDEGAAHLQTALELDPLGKSPRVTLLEALITQRKLVEARRALGALLASSPNFLAGHVLMGLDATMQHDCGEASVQAKWVNAHFPSALANILSAFASGCVGDFSAARRFLEEAAAAKPPAFASPYQLALGYAFIGDKETALSYLEKSIGLRESQILYLKVEPVFDPIRSDPRYIALENRLGLLGQN